MQGRKNIVNFLCCRNFIFK